MIQAEEKDWLETALERLRPENQHPRISGLYAFENVGDCRKFAAGQDQKRGKCTWYVYEVEMPSPSRHPYELIDCIYWAGTDAEDQRITAAIDEYWTPTQDWRRFEYLDQEMSIIRLIPEPDPLTILGTTLRVAKDKALFRKLWPELPCRDG
jgi:hypothetical protein